MKKLLTFIVLSMVAIFGLAGCGEPGSVDKEKPLKVVATIFPLYDWTREIIGDNSSQVELTMLLSKGVDMHSYQPTAEDIMKVSNCDLFIYVGGESDEWVEDALREARNKNMVVLNLMEVLGDKVKREERVEGMKEEREGEHEEAEYDEHIWLSLKNAQILCAAIADALETIDKDHAAEYQKNAAAYEEKLVTLDAEYRNAIETSTFKTLLFGDRFPFRYLTDDYGLKYYAAFSGCSAETEASFETIAFLSGKLDELHLPAVLTIEGRAHRIAEAIAENSASRDRKRLTLDSMQSMTAKDVEDGATYLSVMQKNLVVLKEALS